MPRPSPEQPSELQLCPGLFGTSAPPPTRRSVPFPRPGQLPVSWHKSRHQVLGHLGEEVTLAQLQVLQLLAAQDTCQEDHRHNRRAGATTSRAHPELSPCRGGGLEYKTLHPALPTKCPDKGCVGV